MQETTLPPDVDIPPDIKIGTQETKKQENITPSKKHNNSLITDLKKQKKI